MTLTLESSKRIFDRERLSCSSTFVHVHSTVNRDLIVVALECTLPTVARRSTLTTYATKRALCCTIRRKEEAIFEAFCGQSTNDKLLLGKSTTIIPINESSHVLCSSTAVGLTEFSNTDKTSTCRPSTMH